MSVRIVTGGKAQPVVSRHPPAKSWGRKQFGVRIGDRKIMLGFFGRSTIQVQADLDTVTAHYGISKNDAWKIALHLAANEIRANEAKPNIKGGK